MNSQQFAEYVQQNHHYHPGDPQPIPTFPEIPRIEAPSGPTVITFPTNPFVTQSNPRKYVKQRGKTNEVDVSKKLELFEIQIKNLQRVADALLKRQEIAEANDKHRTATIHKALTQDSEHFRQGMEILAKSIMDTRTRMKHHAKVIDDFNMLKEAYTNNKMEHYLDEQCLLKFNEMLVEIDLTPSDLDDIAKSLGLDTEDNPIGHEPMLVWNTEDVIDLFSGEDRVVHPISV